MYALDEILGTSVMEHKAGYDKVQKQGSIASGMDPMEYKDLYALVRNGEDPRILQQTWVEYRVKEVMFLNKGTTRAQYQQRCSVEQTWVRYRCR